MKKRVIAFVLFIVMSCSFVGVFADDLSYFQNGAIELTTVRVNGAEFDFGGQPIIYRDRTFVPMRKLFETLGASVEWVDNDQLIFATKKNMIYVMGIGQPNIVATDVAEGKGRTITLDVAPLLFRDKTYVPLRAVSETLGAKVDWDDETQTVDITLN